MYRFSRVLQIGGGDIGGTSLQTIHLCEKEAKVHHFHTNDSIIRLFHVHRSTTAICHKSRLALTIEFTSNLCIVATDCLPFFEAAKSLELVDHLEL